MKQLLLTSLLGLSLVLGACDSGDTASETPAEAPADTAAQPADQPTVELVAATEPASTLGEVPSLGAGEEVRPNGLRILDEVVGDGAEAVAGMAVSVHYTGTLVDGSKFDSSLDSGQPLTFTLGQGRVIKGWEEGIAGMKVGGKRRLAIPTELAYEDNPPVASIPPGATLMFTVELLDAK
jgi:FKBP-type peptidyl-prolyl cis-trans isomerase